MECSTNELPHSRTFALSHFRTFVTLLARPSLACAPLSGARPFPRGDRMMPMEPPSPVQDAPVGGPPASPVAQLSRLLEARRGERHIVAIQDFPDPDAIS